MTDRLLAWHAALYTHKVAVEAFEWGRFDPVYVRGVTNDRRFVVRRMFGAFNVYIVVPARVAARFVAVPPSDDNNEIPIESITTGLGRRSADKVELMRTPGETAGLIVHAVHAWWLAP